MNVISAASEGRLRFAQSVSILMLASLLIFYHVYMLIDLFQGRGLSSDASYNMVQAVLRIAIVASLTGVVLGKRSSLVAMWASIGGLVATHYWAHFGNVPVEFTAGRHPLSYLKGFIIPTIITVLFLYQRQRNTASTISRRLP